MKSFAERLLQELQNGLASAGQPSPPPELQAALQAVLRRMDIVTREEFDAQTAVLARTRERLQALEAELSRQETSSGT